MNPRIVEATGAVRKLVEASHQLVAAASAMGLPITRRDPTLTSIGLIAPKLMTTAKETGDPSPAYLSHFALFWDRVAYGLNILRLAKDPEPDLSQKVWPLRRLISTLIALPKPIPMDDPRSKKPCQCTVLVMNTMLMPPDEATSEKLGELLNRTRAGELNVFDCVEFVQALLVPALFTALIPDAMVPITYVMSRLDETKTYQDLISELDSSGLDRAGQTAVFRALANMMTLGDVNYAPTH